MFDQFPAKSSGNTGNIDIGSVFSTQTWEAYFATWDCRKKARGILAKSGMLGASQSGRWSEDQKVQGDPQGWLLDRFSWPQSCVLTFKYNEFKLS